MGFDLDKNSSSGKEVQLSLLDFKMANSSFNEPETKSSTAVDYHSWAMAHMDVEAPKTSRFMTISAAIHAAAMIAIALMSVPLVEQIKTETITIEIEDTPAPRGAFVPLTQGGLPEKITTEEELIKPIPAVHQEVTPGSDDVVVVKPKATKSAVIKNKSQKSVAKARSKVATKATRAKATTAKTTFKAVPATIDDIDAPALDEGALAANTVRAQLTDDFSDDFENIDRGHSAKLAAEKEKMDALAAAMEKEQSENLEAINKANESEAAQLAAMQNSLREKNAQAIAAARASEYEAAERAAAARKAQLAKEAAAAAALARAGNGGSGNGQGEAIGQGAGNNGSAQQSNQVAGVPTGVRSLDQLRQMPGNPRPQYDRNERRLGHAGNVVFVAYISKAGHPSQFRMLSSTGFRNLDSKTLIALKKWRFYPGQEGWVELPFKWDLKGGLQEDGGLLRRPVSSR